MTNTKKKHGNKMKLMSAIGMLTVSAAMLVSSTFAWFSMNKKVTATSMNVTAKSDSKFLQIINESGTFIDSAAQIEATAVVGTKAVKPTSAVKAFTDTTLTALTTSEDAGDIKFVEAYSNDPAVHTRYTNYTDVTTAATAEDNTNDYTLINNFKVRLNPTTGVSSATNLKVSAVTIASNASTANDVMLDSVKVLVVCGDEWAIWNTTGSVLSSSSDVIASTVSSTATDVKVYVYFDGEVTATTTNNATTLSTDGYDVQVEFTID